MCVATKNDEGRCRASASVDDPVLFQELCQRCESIVALDNYGCECQCTSASTRE